MEGTADSSQPIEFKLAVQRVDPSPEQRDRIADGMRILATWLLRHHRKTVRTPKDRSE